MVTPPNRTVDGRNGPDDDGAEAGTVLFLREAGWDDGPGVEDRDDDADVVSLVNCWSSGENSSSETVAARLSGFFRGGI